MSDSPVLCNNSVHYRNLVKIRARNFRVFKIRCVLFSFFRTPPRKKITAAAGLIMMSASEPEAELEVAGCIRGYHVFQEIWTATVGEILACEREPTNEKDRYAVAVLRSGTKVGHLPKKISRVCSLFLLRGGSITCTVVGGRRYSSDLVQGGLEIPCTLHFSGKPKEINKLKILKVHKLDTKSLKDK